MMNVDVPKRFSFEQIKRHPWYTRKNPLLTKDGKMSDPLGLATQMLANLRIDFEQKPSASQLSQDAMQLDSRNFSFTQPENPVMDMQFDWERPPRILPTSQPTEAITCNVQLPSPVTSDHGDTNTRRRTFHVSIFSQSHRLPATYATCSSIPRYSP
ncbi:hypothetical protein EYC84_004191 [Monilinia fructicola]|nr:hypothetical protein EYC84_004191 [Monilinia fructicola]